MSISSPLVDAPTLATELAAPASHTVPVVLDCRWRLNGPPGIDSYREAHIPGAVYVDLDRDLSALPRSAPAGPGGRHPLPSASAFQSAMRAAGVSQASASQASASQASASQASASQYRPVVVYDDGDGLPAARAWWLLRYFGHDQVRVLDGGFGAWTAADLPVTAPAGSPGKDADTPVITGDFTADPGHMPLVDAAGAGALARDGLLLDVRTAERYRGETEPVDPVAGHIPGAVNAPITLTANLDGSYKTPAELTAVFTALAAQHTPSPEDPQTASPASPASPATPAVGVYCGSGVTAARGVLALTLAGIPSALYVGSWSDWITDPARPIATTDR